MRLGLLPPNRGEVRRGSKTTQPADRTCTARSILSRPKKLHGLDLKHPIEACAVVFHGHGGGERHELGLVEVHRCRREGLIRDNGR